MCWLRGPSQGARHYGSGEQVLNHTSWLLTAPVDGILLGEFNSAVAEPRDSDHLGRAISHDPFDQRAWR